METPSPDGGCAAYPYLEKGSTKMARIENCEKKFIVKSFRRIPNPYSNPEEVDSDRLGDPKPSMYMAVVDVMNLPDDIPMKTNPREQKLTTAVAKKIRRSLLAEDGANNFYLLNRGLLLSAAQVAFNNYNNELTILFEDDELHGDVDGGHTYKIIKECRDQLAPGQQYVKLEILTGIEGMFQDLADARNSSVQVKDQSIAELRNQFDIVKRALDKEPFYKEVYFEENAEGSIDVGEIMQVLNMFNIDRYPVSDLSNFPTSSYSGKKSCIDYYLKQYRAFGETLDNPYVKMIPIMPAIFRLFDKVETGMSSFYTEANPGGHYGATKGVVVAKDDSKFYSKFGDSAMDLSTPSGFIYPIVGAFRALVVEGGDGYYRWKSNPFMILKKVGKDLVSTTVDRSRSLGNNPNAVGKDSGNWKTLFMSVLIEVMN